MHGVRMAGWRETVALTELGIEGLVAKLDTGARSSSLHAVGIQVSDDGDRVRFWVPLDESDAAPVAAEAPLQGWRWVKDSGGHSTLRPVVRLQVCMGGCTWTEEVTLADRAGMRHRMLVGRRAMRGHYVVDPSREFLLSNVVELREAASAA